MQETELEADIGLQSHVHHKVESGKPMQRVLDVLQKQF
jgi:hypothetical protein